jgi:hypothetical protein
MLTSPDPIVQRRQMNLAITCPDTSAALLANRWRDVPNDSVALYVLSASSKRMVDARIAESALATLGNRAERLHVRVRALPAVPA